MRKTARQKVRKSSGRPALSAVIWKNRIIRHGKASPSALAANDIGVQRVVRAKAVIALMETGWADRKKSRKGVS